MIYTVADLITRLAGLPPMMPVIAWDEDNQNARYVNTAFIVNPKEDEFIPILQLFISSKAIPNESLAQSYDEQIAEQKEKAMNMARESQKAMRMVLG